MGFAYKSMFLKISQIDGPRKAEHTQYPLIKVIKRAQATKRSFLPTAAQTKRRNGDWDKSDCVIERRRRRAPEACVRHISDWRILERVSPGQDGQDTTEEGRRSSSSRQAGLRSGGCHPAQFLTVGDNTKLFLESLSDGIGDTYVSIPKF